MLFFISFICNAQNDSLRIVSIAAVGDIMLGTDFPKNRLPKNDGSALLTEVDDILASHDLTIGNLEGVLLNGGKPKKKCKDSTLCYLFRTPTRFVKNLEKSGFDFISLANNHSHDFGEAGADTTQKYLRNAGIQYSGVFNTFGFKKVNDIKVAFAAFAPHSNCNPMLDSIFVGNTINKLKKENDILIVSFHGGKEGLDAMNVADSMEMFYGEERGNVYQFAHSAIDAGADLVIGHGPHVPRSIELYKNKLIAYSLGNFCTYEGFSLGAAKGIAPLLSVNIDDKGNFINGKIISCLQKRPKGPVPDDSNKAARLIKKLSKEDFPNSALLIFDDGRIERK